MSGILYHEQALPYGRGDAAAAPARSTMCGAGALGANLAEGLARQRFARLTVIDRDQVEEGRNLSTQPYFRTDIGAFKAKILANTLYQALGLAVTAKPEEVRRPPTPPSCSPAADSSSTPSTTAWRARR